MSGIIGISFERMNESKINLNRGRDASEDEKIRLNLAKLILKLLAHQN